ncbi:GGDEF domain-containing protein, partial [Escherichia coli]|nr:GGDEF domain-containing protein [Escherichia coli]
PFMSRPPDDPATSDEAGRLAALARYAILDTPPECAFDDAVALAAQLCAAPVALVSLLDGDRQWFKARLGFAPRETGLDRSVCRF